MNLNPEAQNAQTKIGLMRGAIDRQGAEIERLRAALEEILTGPDSDETYRIIKDALGSVKDTKGE